MYRVVIADDEVLIRMYIREILENNGYEVVGEAEDGLDAIAVCRQKKPVDEDTLIPAVKIAIHNYKQREAMAKEFHKTQEALDDRKYLDRAKGLVMERKNMSEKEAFTYIRSLSMDKGISMTELSKMLLKAYEG